MNTTARGRSSFVATCTTYWFSKHQSFMLVEPTEQVGAEDPMHALNVCVCVCGGGWGGDLYTLKFTPCTVAHSLISRAHSFPRAAEFRAGLFFFRGIPRYLTFFIRTAIFSQKMTSK